VNPDEIIHQMTLEEKVSLLSGADLWRTKPIPRLGIPSLKMTDGPYGARGAAGKSGPTSACFPVGVAMAASWNLELVEDIGKALGEEAKDKCADILLGPTVNIPRTPLAGRNFECFSEDPLLTARMAVAYIRGVQSKGVGACIKHFVCNDAEFERYSMSSEVPERALHEIYLAPFREALREAQPWAVMSAYNRLNGLSCSENPRLLKEILKESWGFDSLVISDWLGTYSQAAASAGLDLEMPGPGRWMGTALLQMVKEGEISESEIDDKVMRLLRTIVKAGVEETAAPEVEIANDRPEHRRLIRHAGAEAVVLLKNEHEILPLNTGKLRSLALIGDAARYPAIMGGGSSEVTAHYAISLLDAVREVAGDGIHLTHAVGCSTRRGLPLMDFDWLESDAEGRKGLVVEYFSQPDLSGAPAGRWFTERPEVTWTDEILEGVDPNCFSARLTGELIAPASGVFEIGLSSNLACRMWIDDDLLFSNFPDQAPPEEAGDRKLLEARHELESGRRYGVRIETCWDGTLAWRELAIRCAPPEPDNPLQEAVERARQAEVVIVVAGLNKEWESEGFDRQDMRLPGEQDELIRRVTEANPNTIVVLNGGSPVEMPWLEGAAAVLQAWYLGQESGHSIADVLFGKQSPGGRLPVSFPRRLQDNPTYLHYPGENGRHMYGEGIFVGYRYYQRKGIQPRFPFGYGLSYTQFSYRDLELSSHQLQPGETLYARVEVTNSGLRRGSEVVQWYIHQKDPNLARPERWLVGFSKVELDPGEARAVEFELKEERLAYYDDLGQSWKVQPGEYSLLVGSSCEEIHFQEDFELLTEKAHSGQERSGLRIGSRLGELLADEYARQVLRKHLGGLVDHPQIEMAVDLTLEKIAGFAPELLTKEVLAAIASDLTPQ